MRFLLERSGWYYVNVRVPPSMKHVFGQRVTQPLKTKSKSEAQSIRWGAVAAIKEEIKAASGEVAKASAEHWRKRIEEKRFDAAAFNDLAQKIARKHGDAAAAEFSERSFSLRTDLETREAEWFADAKFEAKTESHYKHALVLLRQHLQRQGLPECIESVNDDVAVSFKGYYVEKGTHRKTLASYLSGLRSRWQMLIDSKVIKGPNVWRDVRPKTQRVGTEAPVREWHADEPLTLFGGPCTQGIFNLLSILLLTGCRLSEALRLVPADLDGNMLVIRTGKTKAAVRRVGVASCLRDGIVSAVAGIKGTPNSWTNRFIEYRRKIGLTDERTVLHSLRHIFMTLADS